MIYRELAPAAPLRQYVRCYWLLSAAAPTDPVPQRILPDGCVEIVLNFAAPFLRHHTDGGIERQPQALVVGPTTRHLSISATGTTRLVGIRFLPGGAYPFLLAPPSEMRDTAPPLIDVAPRFADGLLEQLADAVPGSEGGMLDAALGACLARARRLTDRRVLASVRATYAAKLPLRVDGLVAVTGLGTRQIERAFLEAVGYGPKTLCRLVRFQRVVRALEPSIRPSWARLAAQNGYADQSHLAREFRRCAGTTLTSYVRELHPMSDRFHAGPVVDEPQID
jgi:AraC-like DNA-binding protein